MPPVPTSMEAKKLGLYIPKIIEPVEDLREEDIKGCDKDFGLVSSSTICNSCNSSWENFDAR